MKKPIAIAVLAVGLTPALADASRLPTRAERAGIMREFDRDAFYEGYGRSCVAFRIRVSTVDDQWAKVAIRGTRPSCRVQPDVQSFVHTRTGWWMHQYGNGGGCRMPARVREDLRLFCA